MKKYHYGFTLIELSLVLVIIGLVIGGVIVGKDLIKAAELRATLSQKDQYTSVVTSFKAKYGALPGDMHPDNTTQFGLFTFTESGAGGGGIGNNDGLIDGYIESHCANECGAFWRHLSDAGMIPTIGATLEANTESGYAGAPAGVGGYGNANPSLHMPKSAMGNKFWGVSTLDGDFFNSIPDFDENRNAFFLATPGTVDINYLFTPNMSGMDAYLLDVKIDDGKPIAGRFLVSTYDANSGENGFYWGDGSQDRWGDPLTSQSKVCTIGVSLNDVDLTYNLDPAKGANNPSCYPVFVW